MSRLNFINDKVDIDAKIRNRNNQVLHLTEDTIWESDKNTSSRKHKTQKSQEVSPFPAGDREAARNRHINITKINVRYQ